MDGRTDRTLWVAGLTLIAGMTHLLLVGDHLAGAIGSGLFFLGVGVGQILWAAALARGLDARWHGWGAAALLVAPTVLYLVTRVVRAPWSGGPEHIDAAGIVTVVAQLAALLIMIARPIAPSSVPAVGVGLLLAAAMYGGALGAESVDWLSNSASLHGHSHGHSHGDDHAHDGHAHGGAPMAGMRGVSIVGNVTYFGPATAQALLDACEDFDDARMDCWVHHLRDQVEAFGPVPAFDMLEAIGDLDADARAQGHTMAHELGHHAYMAYGLDIAVTLSNCSYKVFQGCIHGALQAYFGDLAGQGEAVDGDAMNTLCSGTNTSFEEYACNHGVGHGVMMYTNYDLHGSLDTCRLMDGGFRESACYGGVYMENVHGYFDSLDPDFVPHDHGGGPPTYWVSPDDPAYPCNEVKSVYANSCWVMQTSLILHFNGVDFRDASAVCDEAGDSHLSCYRGLGRLARPYADGNPALMSKHCSYGDEEEQTICVRAFVAGAISDANDPDAGRDLCPDLADAMEIPCHEEVGEQAGYMLGDAVADYCDDGPAEFVDACRRGAGLD